MTVAWNLYPPPISPNSKSRQPHPAKDSGLTALQKGQVYMYSTASIHFDTSEVVELDVQEYLSGSGADPYWVVSVNAASLGRIGRPANFFCSNPEQVRALVPTYQSSSELADARPDASVSKLITRCEKELAAWHAAADHAVDLEAEGSGTGWLPA